MANKEKVTHKDRQALVDDLEDIIGGKRYPADSYYKKFFFKHASLISTILFFLGLLSSVIIFITTGDIFRAAAVIFLLVWLVVFLRYFLWAVYHYNVNHGISIKNWEKIDDAKERLKRGDVVLKSELREPLVNPYRSQTFGVPPGTVRGMLAFTLLFGAIAILIASMGMERVDLENSLIRDQFEFFKTAFLMMMAFYFGDKSLRFLQNRWKDPNSSTIQTTTLNKQGEEVEFKQQEVSVDDPFYTPVAFNGQAFTSRSNTGGMPPNDPFVKTPQQRPGNTQLQQDDRYFLEDDVFFAEKQGLNTSSVPASNMTVLKDKMNTFVDLEDTPEMVAEPKSNEKEVNIEDGQRQFNYPCTPIIDSGHGGIIDGTYTTGEKKRYTFTGEGQEPIEIFEGEINRKIARKLIVKLNANGLPYHDLNSRDPKDEPLWDRVRRANAIYKEDASAFYLSIHSNASASGIEGSGGRGHGFEIFTSVGETPSDLLARIAGREYQRHFNGKFRFRGVKEMNFRVLNLTKCPAILVENLFFDNYFEAKYLLSEEGQDAIANCLLDVIRSIHFHYEAIS